jgi:hypothetical protein
LMARDGPMRVMLPWDSQRPSWSFRSGCLNGMKKICRV